MQIRIFNFPRLALLLSLVGLLVGLGVSFLVTPRYTSTAALEFLDGGQSESPIRRLTMMQNETLSRTSLSYIIQDPRLDLYPEQRLSTPLEDVIDAMRRDIQIETTGREDPQSKGYLAFRVTFTYSDRLKARQTVQALVSHFMDWSIEHASHRSADAVAKDEIALLESRIAVLEQRLGIAHAQSQEAVIPAGIELGVLDPPSMPARPVYPDRYRFMSIGFGSGIVLALVLTILRRRPQPPAPFPLTSTS